MKLPYKFGNYVLIKKIANGGMAEVYRAKYHGASGFAKEVAVKRILPLLTERKDIEKMFINEAKALVHLQHQNIVQVLELNKDGEYYFIAMEFVDGVDLRQIYNRLGVKRRILPEKYGCFVIVEILKALDFAHKQKDESGKILNIVHRDISPQNILISYNGEVKLTDFGIAKGMHREEETTTAQLKGKYAYMSPEQALGENVDSRSDLYSLGIILYELLSGKRLFRMSSDFETMRKVRESALPDAWEVHFSLGMRKILVKALARNPEKRYTNAAEFLKDINSYIALKKLHTYGLEISSYLKNIFDGSEPSVEPVINKETKVLTRISGKKEIRRFRISGRYAALYLFCSFFLSAGIVSGKVGGDSVFIKQIGDVPPPTSVIPPITAEINVPKAPAIDGRAISIISTPEFAEAEIEYDGIKKKFITPFVLTDIKEGMDVTAKLVLKKEGYKTLVDEISLPQTKDVITKEYRLVSTAPAHVSVQVRPWGYIYIPGIISKMESPARGIEIKPGRHQVKVFYAPTNTWAAADLQADAGGSYTCRADFTKRSKMYCK